MRSGDTMSSSSTNLMLTVLSMAFEYAIDMELYDNNPCIRLKRIPSDCKQVEAFTREEQKKSKPILKIPMIEDYLVFY